MLEYVNQDQICKDQIKVELFVKERCSNKRSSTFNWDYYIGEDGKYYFHPNKAEELHRGLVRSSSSVKEGSL